MKTLSLFLLLGIVFFATGCPNQPSKSFKDKNTLVSNVNDYLTEQQLRFNCARDEGKRVVGTTCQGALEAPLDVAKRVRNDALEDAISVIDSNYNDYITNLDQRRSKGDFLLDVIDLGASAATGITKGERPNQILGIGITAFRGGRRSIELNFYKQQTIPILITKMDDNRARVYASILQKRDRTADEYTMKAAVRDIVEYYNAGTLIRAFAELGKDAAAQAKASERAVRVLRGDVEITDIPTIEAAGVSQSIADLREGLEEKVDDAVADAAAAAAAVPTPTPLPAGADAAAQQAFATATADAKKKQDEARAEKLKPIKDKLEAALREVVAEPAFAPAIAQMKTDPEYKPILDKRAATPPQPLTEDDYFALLAGLVRRIQNDMDAMKKLQAILRNANK